MVVFVIIEETLFENENPLIEIVYITSNKEDCLSTLNRQYRLAIADMCNKAEGELDLNNMTFIVKSIENNDIVKGRIEQHYVYIQEEE